jgi:hypothetical protein
VLFRFGVEFFFAEDVENLHLLHDLAHVLDGVDDVSGAETGSIVVLLRPPTSGKWWPT